jgi:flavin reductase (DIM6/NTAB) family NADH-FMN oxidoreductase RutF
VILALATAPCLRLAIQHRKVVVELRLVTTVCADGKREGMTVNSFTSVSLEPLLILWSIRNDTGSGDAFIAGRAFNLSELSREQRELALHFACPAPDKFERFESEFNMADNACPRLGSAVATFECSTYSRHQEGDHTTILLGRVDQFNSSDEPLLLLHSGQMGSLWDLAQLWPGRRDQPQRKDAR